MNRGSLCVISETRDMGSMWKGLSQITINHEDEKLSLSIIILRWAELKLKHDTKS